MMTGKQTSGKNFFLFSGCYACRVLAALIAVCLLIAGPETALAKAGKSGNSKYASIVMDAATGEILSQSNADKPLHPASLTKAMTLLLTFEALSQGRIGINDNVRMSRYAAGMAPSKLGVKAGDSLRVKDAIGALVTKSANDVAAAMAEHLGGTESGFARQMTRRAHDIGMSRTIFVNASGLHDPRQISTARDMAVMARYIIRNYPEYYRYFSMSNFTYQGRTYRNHNRLMETYKGMDGMKTGYVAASGFNLVASAVRGEKRLIGVVFGGRTTVSRNNHMAALLDQGFDRTGSGGDLLIASARQNGVSEKFAVYEKPSSVPVPGRKPAISVAPLSVSPGSLNAGDLAPADRQQEGVYALASAAQQMPAPGEPEALSGEGDADPGISRRIETGLLAIAAHRAPEVGANAFGENAPRRAVEYRFSPEPGIREAAYVPPASAAVPPAAPGGGEDGVWSVQIGAFASRAATDRTLHEALRALPDSYTQARPVIAPLKTANGWLFRARLGGFTRGEALAACNYLRDCLPVAPQN